MPLTPAAALLLGRAGGPRYRGSEVLRLGHVTSIVAALVPATRPFTAD